MTKGTGGWRIKTANAAYQKIAADKSAPRESARQALLHLAGCYEKPAPRLTKVPNLPSLSKCDVTPGAVVVRPTPWYAGLRMFSRQRPQGPGSVRLSTILLTVLAF